MDQLTGCWGRGVVSVRSVSYVRVSIVIPCLILCILSSPKLVQLGLFVFPIPKYI